MGIRRGTMIVEYCKIVGDAQVVAICDSMAGRLEWVKASFDDPGITYYLDFDEFINHDMECC